jgi:hypothetical protein
MADQSWDNSGLPVQKKGMPTWGKVLMGCGVVLLLITATCAGCVFWGVNKVKQASQQPWAELQRAMAQMKTEEGAKTYYEAHPGLTRSYPTEADFLKAASLWRPKLGDVPATVPGLMELAKHGGGFNMSVENGVKRMELRYTLSSGARVEMEWTNDKLTDLQIQ